MDFKKELIIGGSFYFFLTLLFFSPLLPGGKTFIPADVLDQNYLYPPREKKIFVLFERWEAVIHSYPNDAFYNRELKKGNFPLWNPYLFSGYPLFANGQNGFLNPFKILFHLLLPPHRARELFLFVHLFFTGFFTFIFLRGMNLSLFPSLIGGFIWSYNSFNMTLFQHEYVYSIAPYIPLLLLSYERALKENNFLWRGTGGISFALIILGKHLNYSFYGLIGFLVFAIYRIYQGPYIKALKEFFFIAFIGFLIAAVQLIPTIELITLSSLQRPAEYHSLPVKAILQFVGVAFFHPLIYDSSFHEVNLYHPYNLYQTCGFAGNFAVFLSVFNLFSKHRKNDGLFFLGCAFIFYLIAFYTPFTRIFESIFPFVKKTVPVKTLYIAVFSISIASAYGLDCLLKEEKGKWLPVIIPSIFVFAAGIIAVRIKADSYPYHWFHPLNPAILSPVVIVLLSAFIFTFPLSPASKGILSIFISFLELFPLAVIYNLPVSSKLLDMKNTYFDSIKNEIGYYRMTGLQPNLYPLLSIQSVDGYESLIPDGYFFAIKEEIPTDPADMRLISIPNIEYPMARLLGVKYIIGTDRNYKIPQDKLEKVLDGDVVIYRLKDVLPRAFVVGNSKKVEREKMREMVLGGEDPLNAVLLEEDVECRGEGGNAEIISYEPERVKIRTEVNGECGFLVLSDTYYPGWKVYVDGKREKILKAYGFIRAVKVGGGVHTVEFVFKPLTVKIGMVLSIVGILFAFSFLLLGKRPEPFVEETIKLKFEAKALLPLILILPVFISWFFYYREVIGMMNSRWNTVMAATLLSRGEEESALSHLKEALSSKYVYPEAYLKMGLFLSQKKSYADAIFYLLKALSYYPSLPILYRSLSEASFYAGDINSSIDFAKTYYEMERSHESAVWFAIILLKSGRSRDAFNFLRSVKKYYYDSPIILILYGLANMAMGNTQDALFFWQKGFYLLKDLPPDFIKEIKTLLGALPPQYREQKEELLKMFENK
jgi:hypothetical protein